MTDVLVETRGLTKAFSGKTVLNAVDVSLRKGEIFGIIGENGAGKSTFIKLLAGIHSPTAGTIGMDGKEYLSLNPDLARRLGITAIPQETNLVPDLNVYENVFLGWEYRRFGAMLDRRRMMTRAGELLRALETPVAPDASLASLSIAEKQMVEIAKAVVHSSRLLILDEPTTVLTRHETDVLFGLVRRLRDAGTCILYISHRLKEVRELCDRVMVLRDGDVVGIEPTANLDEADMAKRMVGRELTQMFPPKATPTDDVLFSVGGLTVPGTVSNIGFRLRRGEVLGFAGLVGAGRTEVAEAIMGLRRKASGKFTLHGKAIEIRSPRDAVRHGLAYLAEDRQAAGILTAFDVTSNVTLSSLSRYGRILTRVRAERERAEHYVQRFGIRTPSVKTRLEFLSGGNQQKVALAKGLDTAPAVFILDEPTRGIDVNARHEVYAFIRKLAHEGLGCILIASDMEELIGMANRVVVMREGSIVGELNGGSICEEEIMLLATGVTGSSASEGGSAA